ncbi:NTP transferase domain-containing protein [Aliarcobacter skirrowii]|uniref:sugar phosphate nucleotidyltransferase n=1 Tax=Aliarcobacter skirrowii TaxID=28200 RepID=UPI0029AF4A29|nr:NTP transferase domain-containing protein [Aliarcobacter skirrowii]MDX4071136.1 NTP transferase domain-containing protein [Aliarcobacter skirrowii]
MQVIILVAGQGNRMKPLTQNIHKSLLPLNYYENFLSRLLHQLNEYEISKVIVVTGYLSSDIEKLVTNYQLNVKCIFNERYKEDTNIYSMKLALEHIDSKEPTVILEGDVYLDDLAMRDIIKVSETNKSIWFTKNKFYQFQYGGILKKDRFDNVLDIKIVSNYEEKFSNYFKLLGIMTIGTTEINKFKKLVDYYCNISIEQYYLVPWIEHLEEFSCISYDLGNYFVESVNTAIEFEELKIKLENLYREEKVLLIPTNDLFPIEEYIEERKEYLKEKILKEKLWIKPIIIEKEHKLILDGHHRFAVAKELGLNILPVIEIEYKDIELWSLKKSQEVTKELVIERAKNGHIYPNKTVKHKFLFKIPYCSYSFEELK